MKTLNINLNSLLVSVFMLMAMFLVGCEKDTENPVAPIFPELTDIPCSAGETKEITFEANMDWTLTSSAAWCKFVSGDFKETTISGKEGSNTVKVEISDFGQNYSTDDVAEIKLKYGDNEQKVIAKFTRAHKIFTDIAFSDAEGNKYDYNTPIIIKSADPNSSEEIIITVTSDFPVGLPSNPDWINVSLVESGVYKLSFNKDNQSGVDIKYSFGEEKGYTLPFSVDYNGEIVKVEIPVGYAGLKSDYISFEPDYISLHVVSSDAKVIRTSESFTGIATKYYKNELVSNIVSKDDDFEFVTIKLVGDYMPGLGYEMFYPNEFIFNQTIDWIKLNNNNGEVSIKFSEFSTQEDETYRAAYVMAIPRELYESIKDDLYGNIISSEQGYPDLAPDFQKYLLANIVQVDKIIEMPSVSFKGFIDNEGYFLSFEELESEYGISIQPFTEAGDTFGTKNVHIASIPSQLLSFPIYIQMVGYDSTKEVVIPQNEQFTISKVERDGNTYISVICNKPGLDSYDEFNVLIKENDQNVGACMFSFFK